MVAYTTYSLERSTFLVYICSTNLGFKVPHVAKLTTV